MRPLLLVPLGFAFAACGDLDVRSVRPTRGVPDTLQGEWIGWWQSTSSNQGGALVFTVQEFDGEPVVNLSLDNPCVEPRDYELVLTPSTIELRLDGRTVLAAVVGEGRSLLGTYECVADLGTFEATWQRELPELVDLSGTWDGTVTVGATSHGARLQLQQEISGGRMLLQGELDLGGFWPVPIPVSGTAMFRDAGFDLMLHTGAGAVPALLLSGFGEREPLRLPFGLLHVFGGSLPFPQAVLQLDWQQR